MAVFPAELKGILNHLLHQLEGLLDPGPGQGGEVHHRRVHLHVRNTQHFTACCGTLNGLSCRHRWTGQQEHGGSPPGTYNAPLASALPQGTPSWLPLFSDSSH